VVWLHVLSDPCRCVSAALFRPVQQTHTDTDLTYSMEQSPWEVNRFSLSQEITSILWNPKFQYHIHKCSPPVPILSQLDPVHNPTSNFLNTHLNIILPSTLGSSMWSVSLLFSPSKHCINLYSPHTFYVPRPSLLLDFITRTVLCEEYRSFSDRWKNIEGSVPAGKRYISAFSTAYRLFWGSSAVSAMDNQGPFSTKNVDVAWS